MIAPGTRFGHLVVREELPGAEVGRDKKGGAWCRVRCDCGLRKLMRSRHLRQGHTLTCGSLACRFHLENIKRGIAAAHAARARQAEARTHCLRGHPVEPRKRCTACAKIWWATYRLTLQEGRAA